MANAAVGSYFASQGLRDRTITERASRGGYSGTGGGDLYRSGRSSLGREPSPPSGADAASAFGGSPDLAALKARAERARREREAVERGNAGAVGRRHVNPMSALESPAGSPDLGAPYRRTEFYPTPTQPGSAQRAGRQHLPAPSADDSAEDVVAGILHSSSSNNGRLATVHPGDFSAMEEPHGGDSSRHAPYASAPPVHDRHNLSDPYAVGDSQPHYGLAFHTRHSAPSQPYGRGDEYSSMAAAPMAAASNIGHQQHSLPGDADGHMAQRIAEADDVASMLAAIDASAGGAGNFYSDFNGGGHGGMAAAPENATIAAARRALRPHHAAHPRSSGGLAPPPAEADPVVPESRSDSPAARPSSGQSAGPLTGRQLAAELEMIISRSQPAAPAAVGTSRNDAPPSGAAAAAPAAVPHARVVVTRTPAAAPAAAAVGPSLQHKDVPPLRTNRLSASVGADGDGGEPAPAMPPRASVVRVSSTTARSRGQRQTPLSSPRYANRSDDASTDSTGTTVSSVDESDTYSQTPAAERHARHIAGLRSPGRGYDDASTSDDEYTDSDASPERAAHPQHHAAAGGRHSHPRHGPHGRNPTQHAHSQQHQQQQPLGRRPVTYERDRSAIAPTERTEVIAPSDFNRLLSGGQQQPPFMPQQQQNGGQRRRQGPLAPPPLHADDDPYRPPLAPSTAASAGPMAAAVGSSTVIPRSSGAMRGERHPPLVDLSQQQPLPPPPPPPLRHNASVRVLPPPPPPPAETPREGDLRRSASRSSLPRAPSVIVRKGPPTPQPAPQPKPEPTPKPAEPPVRPKDERVKSRGCFC